MTLDLRLQRGKRLIIPRKPMHSSQIDDTIQSLSSRLPQPHHAYTRLDSSLDLATRSALYVRRRDVGHLTIQKRSVKSPDRSSEPDLSNDSIDIPDSTLLTMKARMKGTRTMIQTPLTTLLKL